VPDGALPPEPEDHRLYEPSSHPGCRAPHAWLADGRSTLDLFGNGFTLLDFGGPEESLPASPVPLKKVAIQDPAIARLYERRYVLVRPDGHVAWRADRLPADFPDVLDRVRGASAGEGQKKAPATPLARCRGN
jgi:hypothetical protein